MEKYRREAKDKITSELVYLEINLDLQVRYLRILRFDPNYLSQKDQIDQELKKTDKNLMEVKKKLEILESVYGQDK